MQSHLQKPWAPAHDAELTPGSMHSARVLVGSKHTCKLLKIFIGRAQDVAAGLNDLEYEDMLLLFQDDHPLLVYLEAVEINRKEFCMQEADVRTFLHDVAAAVPVCAVVPPSIWHELHVVMAAAKFGSAGDRSQFRERAPILHDFLAWDMSKNGSSLSSSAIRLLEMLLSLARAAYMPATMGEYKGCSKRAQKQSDVVSGASAAVALGDNINGLPGTAYGDVPSVASYQGASLSSKPPKYYG
ncbi:TPA: hypothetical protein ACH3X1_000126 [Trebouxia sp. C0004]